MGPKLKIYVETIYSEHLLFLEKNIFVSNFSNFILWNMHFLLYQVEKITNKNIFFKKYKMLTAYGFHIDFQFRDHKWLLTDV